MRVEPITDLLDPSQILGTETAYVAVVLGFPSLDAPKLVLPLRIKEIVQVLVETMLTKDLPFLRVEPHPGALGTLIHGQGVTYTDAVPSEKRSILRTELGDSLIYIDGDDLLRLAQSIALLLLRPPLPVISSPDPEPTAFRTAARTEAGLRAPNLKLMRCRTDRAFHFIALGS